MTEVHLLCAGAAQGLVRALESRFSAATEARLQAQFGAVGAMKEALLAGAACDVMVVTAAMIEDLIAAGKLRSGTGAALGKVRTGIGVRAGDPAPKVDTPEALHAALLAAEAIYFPDPLRATAGIHFARVMRELGIEEQLRPRFRTYPSGAIAMRELAVATAPRAIGCTQVTEIKYTPGLSLVGMLPGRFELATVYQAAISAQAAQPELAARFIALLTGPESQALRADSGFEI